MQPSASAKALLKRTVQRRTFIHSGPETLFEEGQEGGGPSEGRSAKERTRRRRKRWSDGGEEQDVRTCCVLPI